MNNAIQDFFSSKLITKFINSVYKILILEFILIVYNLPLMFSLFFVPIEKKSVTMFILLGLTLYPSLTAIYRFLWNLTEDIRLRASFKTVWKYYKEDFVRNSLLSLIFCATLFITIFDFYYLKPFFSGAWIDIVLLVVLLIWGIFYFSFSSLSAHFQLTLKNLLTNTLYLMYSHFIYLINSVIVIYALVITTKVTNLPILQITIGGIVALYSFSRFSDMITKETTPVETSK